MNRSTILRILRALTIVAVLALAAVGLEQIVAALSQGSGRGPRTQARVVQPEVPSARVTAPPPVQIQPTATATVMAPPPVQVKVEGHITAVNAAAGTITVQDDDGGPATIVALGAARGTFYVGEKLKVVGTLTGAGGSAATVQAGFIQLEPPEASESAPPAAAPGATIKVKGFITAVNPAAGTITVQDDDGGPATVVALGAAAGTYDVGQKVKVAGTLTGAGSSAATVQAQYVTPDDAPAPTAAIPVGAHVKVEGRITAANTAAGTITVQDDDAPPTVIALGAARGTFYVGQEVEVAGIKARAGSNGATVQAQFIRLKSPDGD
jgi:hypothetical protein